MQRLLWASLWLGLTLAQTTVAPSASPTYGSGISTDCVKQRDLNPCPRPYFFDFTPVGNFAFFSCGADGYARCRYNPATASVVPGTCSLQTSPCGLEAKAAPTYDFSSALNKYAYFSCDIDYYRCSYDPNNGTMSNCNYRVSPCPFTVEAFFAIGNVAFFACSADGYYECTYDPSTGIVGLDTCVQKSSPCDLTHDVSITIPYAYLSCGEGGLYKCGYDAANSTISSDCTRVVSPCAGNVKRTYSFITQGNWAFFDCYNDGYYRCKYNTPPLWNTTGPCVVSANCVTSSNYPTDYSSSEVCVITPLVPQLVHFDDFTTENGYDFLTVNNRNYTGRNRPADQNVSTPILWASDINIVASGWRFCGVVPPSPAPPSSPSTNSPSVRITFPTPAILGSVAPSSFSSSVTPSIAPSTTPSAVPSVAPSSAMPSSAPSSAMPSSAPSTLLPTSSPTPSPTGSPTPDPTGSPSITPTSSPVTKAPTVPTAPAVAKDTAGIAIGIILIIALCGLLAVSALFWWRKSRRAATISPEDAPPSPSPRPVVQAREVREVREVTPPEVELEEKAPQALDDENDSTARGSTTIEML